MNGGQGLNHRIPMTLHRVGLTVVLSLACCAFWLSCSTSRSSARTPEKAYNPCGDLQTNLFELQQIEDELADPGPDYTLDQQKQAQDRKQYLNRVNERLKKDCGR